MDAAAARTIACALVVLVHVNMHVRPGLSTWWPGGVWLAPVFGLSMPTFLLLSGYFAARPPGAVEAGSLRRRLSRLLPPYVVWTLVMTAFGIPAMMTWQERLTAASVGLWHLYYIFALAQLLTLSALVEPRLGQRGVKALVLVCVGCTGAIYAASSAVLWVHGADFGEWEIAWSRLGLTWAGFYGIGVGLRRLPGAAAGLRRHWKWAAAAVVPAFGLHAAELALQDAVYGHASRKLLMIGAFPFQVLVALALVGGTARFAEAPALRWLARSAPDSMGVYLCHTTILVLLYEQLRQAGLTSVQWYEVPLVALAVWLLSTGTVRGVRRLAPARLTGWLGMN